MMINGVWQVDIIRKDNRILTGMFLISIRKMVENATELGGENLCVTKVLIQKLVGNLSHGFAVKK